MASEHRKRVFKALEHEKPDRVPVDEPPGWRADILKRLLAYFNTNDLEKVRKALGVDFRLISAEFKWRSWERDPSKAIDEWGIVHEPTSTGLHSRFYLHPLADATTAKEINEYPFPELVPERFEKAEKQAKIWKKNYVISAMMESTLFEMAWYLRGFQRLLMDMIARPNIANALLDKLLKYRMEMVKYYIDIGADIIRLGDDVGWQRGMILSPDLWRRYLKPRMKALIDHIKKHSNAYIFYHSDGYIMPIIPELIEIGVQILNPVQPECMDPVEIKKRYGDKLVLHGTIGVQSILPFGTPEDVKNEVIKRIKECGMNGGLIIAPSHTPQPETPIKNIVAMYKAATSFKLS